MQKRFRVISLVLILLLLIIGSIRVVISTMQRSSPAPAVTPSPENKIPLPEVRLLTQEDLKALKEIIVSHPQAREETQALTKEDVRFLVDEKIVTREEAKALLELDKLVPTN